MVENLKLAAATYAFYSPYAFAIVVALLAMAVRANPEGRIARAAQGAYANGTVSNALDTLFVLGGFAYAGAIIANLVYPSYLGHAQSLVAASSWLSRKGIPLYPMWDRHEGLFGTLYGPLVFEINAVALAISPTIFASKLLGSLMPFASAALLYAAFHAIEKDRRMRLRQWQPQSRSRRSRSIS